MGVLNSSEGFNNTRPIVHLCYTVLKVEFQGRPNLAGTWDSTYICTVLLDSMYTTPHTGSKIQGDPQNLSSLSEVLLIRIQ